MTYPKNWPQHATATLLVLLLSLGLSYWLWLQASRSAEQERQARLEGLAQTLGSQLQQRMRAQELVLRGVQGLVDAGQPLGQDGLHRYMASLRLGDDLAGLDGLGWASWVASPKGVSAPLQHWVSAGQSGSPSPQLDLWTDPDFRQTLEQARARGTAVLSGKRLPVPGSGSGFAMVMAVYPLAAQPGTEVLGWVVSSYRMAGWMGALPESVAKAAALQVFDGTVPQPQSLLFDSGAAPAPQDRAATTWSMALAGRSWSLRLWEPPGPDPGTRHAQVVGRTGLGMSLLLALLTWLLVTDRTRVSMAAVRMTAELRASKEHLELIFDTSPDGMVVTRQADGRIIDINKGFTAMTGYQRDVVLHRVFAELSVWKSEQDRQHYLRELAEQQRCDNLELVFACRSGQHTVGILSAQAATFKGVACYVGVIRDITARKIIEDRVAHMAQHDTLTGLPNRRLFDDRLHQAMVLATRHRTRLAILYIDLDHFKPVNDSLGHAAGDGLLMAAAQRMQESVRASDTVARIGGDEFVVLLPEVHDEADALAVAEKIRKALQQPFVLLAGQVVQISSSMGVALYPEHGRDEAQLSGSADSAMYRAKQQGRNQVVLCGPQDRNSPDGARLLRC